MSYIDDYMVSNYGFFGESISRHIKKNKKEFRKRKEELKKEGIYLLPVQQLHTENTLINKKFDNSLGGLQLCTAFLSPDDQEQIVELSKHIPEPKHLIDQTIALQEFRIGKGLQEEREQGHLLDSTEIAISNLVSMIQTKKNIDEGQEINVNVNNSISNILDELEEEENDKVFDIEIN